MKFDPLGDFQERSCITTEAQKVEERNKLFFSASSPRDA